MTSKEKTELIKKKLTGGDKRSFNEIAADLELELWGANYNGSRHEQVKNTPTENRKRALIQLEEQLIEKTKPNKGKGSTKAPTLPLTQSDIDRIQIQISILKSKIKNN